MNYRILTLSDPAIGEYSAFIRSHAASHFLQDPAWAAVKPNWSWRGIAVYQDDGAMVGAMSVLLRSLPLGFSVAYAPRGPVCDREDPAVLETLFAGAKELARAYKCILTYLDPDEPETNQTFASHMTRLGFLERHSDAFGGVQPQSVFRISLLGADEQMLLSSFAQKTRYNIRLAQRRGVTVNAFPGSAPVPQWALDSFSQLMYITGERDHFLVRGKDYFQGLLSALGSSAVLYLARKGGQTLAGTLAIFYGGKAWYLYGASANEDRGAMPNYLLQWRMIQDALEQNCVFYDFRGVPGTGEPADPLYGLYRFKKGFAGVHTRFTGLFIFYHRPWLGRIFDFAQNRYRNFRRKKLHKR